jgi:hypothetical protein
MGVPKVRFGVGAFGDGSQTAIRCGGRWRYSARINQLKSEDIILTNRECR